MSETGEANDGNSSIAVERGDTAHEWCVRIDGPAGRYVFMNNMAEDSWMLMTGTDGETMVLMRHSPGGSYHLEIHARNDECMFVSHIEPDITAYHYTEPNGGRALVSEDGPATRRTMFYQLVMTVDDLHARVDDMHQRAMAAVNAAREEAIGHLQQAAV